MPWRHDTTSPAPSPNIAALEAAVASGAARAVGGVALDTLCSQLKAESKAAIGSLFAAVSLRVGLDGTPIIGGSIGDEQSFQSVGFDPVEQAVIYTATKHVLTNHSVTGGDVEITGDIQLQLKVTAAATDEASVAAALAVIAIGTIVLLPVAAWAATPPVEAGVGTGLSQILVRLGALAH
jgi:hypothetical protein